ncbi:MAG: selenide, water dikinase SelD [Deltaproteobacteria bacterium]|nr:selenide, water dikinase SelD [Deltaproteobacteria bacterium]
MPELVYLDYNATTPIAPEVAEAMRPFLETGWGNPSSSHAAGIRARRAIEQARAQVAALLGCETDEVVFTGGGTESNNMAIQGVAWALRERGRHLITSAVEHPAVGEVLGWLEGLGWEVTVLPVDETGRVNLDAARAAFRPDTVLLSVMHANNEVGTVQPIAELAALARERGVVFHADGAQAVGKIPAKVRALGVDLYSVAGHKLYGPKGVGALYIRRGTPLVKIFQGADHEGNRRPGTENTLGIVGLGAAAALAMDLPARADHLRAMRDRLHQAVLAGVPDAHLNGHPEERLPNTLSLAFPEVLATSILDALADEVAASAGAACHADQVRVSTVLQAMRVPEHLALGTIRLSTGASSTEEEIDRAAAALVGAVHALRGEGCALVMTPDAVRLTHHTHGLGCACKLRPALLEEALRGIPLPTDPAVLVGLATRDDAAVYRLTEALALVGTVDFFTPIVDDPYDFGAIAVANALSDVYAMGGRPLFGLNLVGFPVGRLPESALHELLRGASDKAAEAGVAVLGGHSVEDTEPKFGMAVYGVVHPDRVRRNGGALPGDALILTKPLGSGILATAAKRGAASAGAVRRATEVMATLNRAAAEVLSNMEVHALTDVTGFGLAGHLNELLRASGVGATLWVERLPVLPEALALAAAGMVPGGTLGNREFLGEALWLAPDLSAAEGHLVCDAQTSGGLLAAVPAHAAEATLAALRAAGVAEAAWIGEVQAGAGIRAERGQPER